MIPSATQRAPVVDATRKKLLVPKAFGPYEVRGRLGIGGMSVVLDAATQSGSRVALKILRPSSDDDRNEILRARLLREAQLLARLNHPGVVRLLDYGDFEGTLYLAMERVEGVTLADVGKRLSLTFNEVVALGAQVSGALAHLHGQGIVHRDVKPGNIIINHEGRAILADFGIAWNEDATGITKAGEVVGSAGYVAPECFDGHPASQWSDQYALGRLLFELAALEPAPSVPEDVSLAGQFVWKLEIDWSRFPRTPPWPMLERTCIRRMTLPRPQSRFPDSEACARAFLDLGRHVDDAVFGVRSDADSPELRAVLRGLLGRLNGGEIAADPRSVSDASVLDSAVSGATASDVAVSSASAVAASAVAVSAVAVSEGAASEGAASGSFASRIADSDDRAADGVHGRRRTLLAIVLGLSFGLVLGGVADPGSARRVWAWCFGHEPTVAYRYVGSRPVSRAALDEAGRLLLMARAQLRAGQFEAAERALGQCIVAADLPECHGRLASVLSLRGAAAATVHQAYYFRSTSDGHREDPAGGGGGQ